MTAIAEAIDAGQISPRLWMYANYHCNLACSYCLTESAPSVPQREMSRDQMESLAEQGATLGFRSIGVTGGEPMLVADLPERIAMMAEQLPVVLMTNGTVFNDARLKRMEPLAGLDVTVQISLDSAEPIANDEMRGPGNFAKVVEAVPKLIDLGIHVKIATTLEDPDAVDVSDLCDLHRSLGVTDEDHVVRGMVRRGRAAVEGWGSQAGADELFPELTITDDGAFWSPFAPTVRGGSLDTDLLISRKTQPLAEVADTFLGLVQGEVTTQGYDTRFVCG